MTTEGGGCRQKPNPYLDLKKDVRGCSERTSPYFGRPSPPHPIKVNVIGRGGEGAAAEYGQRPDFHAFKFSDPSFSLLQEASTKGLISQY